MRKMTVYLVLMISAACSPAAGPDASGVHLDTAAAAMLPADLVAVPGRAEFVSAFPTNCSSPNTRDIFTGALGIIRRASRNPKVGVQFEKCDGTAFQTTKTCHVRVGTNAPWGVVRKTFTWPAGARSVQILFPGWPDRSSFNTAYPGTLGAEKLFYLTCDDGTSVAHWRQGHPVAVEKL